MRKQRATCIIFHMEEMKRTPKNPWAVKGESAQQTDLVEVGRMKLEKRVAERLKSAEPKKVEVNIGGPSNLVEQIFRAAQGKKAEWTQALEEARFCNMLMKMPDSTIYYHYKIEGSGRLLRPEKAAGKFPDLLALMPSVNPAQPATADTVRMAAMKFSEIYPEIHFEFTQTHNTIEYKASVRA